MRNFYGHLLRYCTARSIARQRHKTGHWLEQLTYGAPPTLAEAGGVRERSADASNFLRLFMIARAILENYFRLIFIILFIFFYSYLFIFIYFVDCKDKEEIFLRDLIEHSFIDCVADTEHT